MLNWCFRYDSNEDGFEKKDNENEKLHLKRHVSADESQKSQKESILRDYIDGELPAQNSRTSFADLNKQKVLGDAGIQLVYMMQEKDGSTPPPMNGKSNEKKTTFANPLPSTQNNVNTTTWRQQQTHNSQQVNI